MVPSCTRDQRFGYGIGNYFCIAVFQCGNCTEKPPAGVIKNIIGSYQSPKEIFSQEPQPKISRMELIINSARKKWRGRYWHESFKSLYKGTVNQHNPQFEYVMQFEIDLHWAHSGLDCDFLFYCRFTCLYLSYDRYCKFGFWIIWWRVRGIGNAL